MKISKNMKKKYDIITVGGATYDITFFPNKKETFLLDNKADILRQKLLAFEHGAKISSDKVVRGFGGGAANTAVSFANLGFKAAAIAAIGKDIFGKEIMSNLKKRKVRTDFIQKIPKYESDLDLIIIGPDKDRIIFLDNKVKSKLQLNKKCIEAVRNTKWVYLSSLAGDWRIILAKIFAVKNKKNDLKIAWNPGQDQIAGGLKELEFFFRRTDVLILNQDEALQLIMTDNNVKKQNIDPNDIKNLSLIVKSYGPKIIIITCGKSGAWAYDGYKFHFVPIIEKEKKIDTTGVGDAFGSSFIAGLELYGADIGKAMKLGILNTSFVVSAPGAQNGLLTKDDLVKISL